MSNNDAARNHQSGDKAGSRRAKEIFLSTCKWAYRLRSVVLAIPVAAASVVLALYSQINLPDMVGFNMQPSGEFAFTLVKSVAVIGPLAITAVCLLLMFCSKKVLYPWLISIFSLAVPVLILFSNTFPG